MEHVIISDFLAGAILTLVLPVALTTVVALVWWFVLRKSDLADEVEGDPS